MKLKVTLDFCEKFMSTETFTQCILSVTSHRIFFIILVKDVIQINNFMRITN